MKKIILFLLLISSNKSFCQPKYDSREILLQDKRMNPSFVIVIKKFMDSAKNAGFKPVIKQAFRTKEEAKIIYEKNKKLGLAAALYSCHSYGIAVDIWLANDRGEVFSYDGNEYKTKPLDRFPYAKWVKFIKIGKSFGLINGADHNDTDHWELHPKIDKDDWINAQKVLLPIEQKYSQLPEQQILEKIWLTVGL